MNYGKFLVPPSITRQQEVLQLMQKLFA